MININQLKTFVTVVEEQGISSAAEKIALTQPAVSLHIQGLEDCVGTGLFIRRGRGLELNSIGRALFDKAKEMVLNYENAEKSIINTINMIKQDITIGAGPIMSDYVLPHVIASFKKDNANIEVKIEPSETSLIIKGVLDHSFDLGFIGAPVGNEKIEMEEWIEEELLLIVPPNHPFAKRKSINSKELEGQNFIMRKEITGIRMFLEQKLRSAGLKESVLQPAFEVPSTTSVLTSVEAGLGISFVSRWVGKQAIELGTVALVPIENVSLIRNLYIINRKNKRKLPCVESLLTHLRRYKDQV
ncbi:MAG: hypothetical protein VR68_15555 [Peptococcaceae bacterium BRH_c4a]|nr:MAG: hypothetical protein VR68_15555 [Peptococcaceae bacterium BRH_c4a]